MTEALANMALLVLAVEMWVFLTTYAAGSPWWSTRLGQIYIVKTTLLTLVLSQNAASTLISSDYPGRHPIRLSIYAGGSVAMVALWFMLRRYQREGRSVRAAAGDTRSRWRVWIDAIQQLRRRG